MGVDVVFAPSAADMYPPDYATYVDVAGPARGLCGARRPGHFRGVATVLTKLFNIVRPNVAVFGEKDVQQLAVVRRMVADLDFGVRILAVPTVREPDGLALSSRNAYLGAGERAAAPALRRSLLAAAAAVSRGERRAAVLRAVVRRRLTASGARVDYVALVEPSTMRPMDDLAGDGILAAAVFFGGTRLIDNIRLRPDTRPSQRRRSRGIDNRLQ
jgi:pantoate--beta-alanine ligase